MPSEFGLGHAQNTHKTIIFPNKRCTSICQLFEMQKNKSLQRKVKVTCADHYFGAFFSCIWQSWKWKARYALSKKRRRNSDNFLLGLLERNLIFYNLSWLSFFMDFWAWFKLNRFIGLSINFHCGCEEVFFLHCSICWLILRPIRF